MALSFLAPVHGAADAGPLPVRDRQHVAAGPVVHAAANIHKAPRHGVHVLRQKIAKAAAACNSQSTTAGKKLQWHSHPSGQGNNMAVSAPASTSAAWCHMLHELHAWCLPAACTSKTAPTYEADASAAALGRRRDSRCRRRPPHVLLVQAAERECTPPQRCRRHSSEEVGLVLQGVHSSQQLCVAACADQDPL